MNSIVNHMGKYDHRQHVLSDWLAELQQRFQLGEVDTDKAKITWCQLLIGATGSSILAGLEDGATWEAAKETLLARLGAGSVRDKAWASLKQLKRGSKEIIELAGEAEKLAKRLHPRDEEAAERHAIDAFLGALDRPLAAEVQKLGCGTMEEVVSAARRIERILEERPTSGMEQIIQSMQSQIQILTKDLAKAHEQIASQAADATPTAAFAAPPSNAVAAAQPLRPQPVFLLPLFQPHRYHPWLQHNHPCTPLAALHTLFMAMRDPTFALHAGSQTGDLLDVSSVMRKVTLHTAAPPVHYCSACCANRPRKPLKDHQGDKSLNSSAQKVAKAPPGAFKLLGGSPKAKVTLVGCTVGPPITGQLTLEGIPVLSRVDMGASVTCLAFTIWWRYRLEAI